MKKGFKRNLIVAVVAAMMAVPAFSAVNVNADSYASQKTSLSDMKKNGASNKVEGPDQGLYLKRGGQAFNISPRGDTVNGHQVSDSEFQHLLNQSNVSTSTHTSNTTNSSSDSNTETNSDSQSSSSKPEYQSSDTNNGKLVQTGEHTTAKYVGLGAIVVALVIFIIAKIKKLAEEN